MKKMKKIRILFFIGIITVFLWLHFREVSTLGMFRIMPNNPTDPRIGASIFYILDGGSDSKWPLAWVKIGWPLVWQEWPFMAIGLLLGLALGCPIGEFSRWKFVVDELIPEEIRRERDAMRDAYFSLQSNAECMLIRASNRYADAQRKDEEISAEQRKIYALRLSLEEQVHNEEQLRSKLESTEKDLVNARALITKMNKKNRPLGKKMD